jgi:DNA-binding PadR family transcriptional regulator
MSRGDQLTTTSYAILGLLSLRDWSTYELAQQMTRSMRLWWPRAESRIYEEPKRLVRLGLATSTDEGKGRRPRTVYTITDAGRQALCDWVAKPAGIFQMEFEAMLKIFFADQGSKADLLANITAVRDAAEAELEHGKTFAREYLADGGPFPNRLHIIALVVSLYEELLNATHEWAEEALDQVQDWPNTRQGTDPLSLFQRVLTRPSPAETHDS